MSKIWVISDTHFLHDNIVKYCGRPINHDAIMLDKLKVVGPEDTLIHCGDVVFSPKKVATRAKEVFAKLPGKRKILIRGNHDKKYNKKLPWDEVHDKYEIVYGGVKFHFQHYSYKLAENVGPGIRRFLRFFFTDWCNKNLKLPNADVCCFGHIHNLGQRYLWNPDTKQLVANMCVEHWDFRPVCIDELVEEYKERFRRDYNESLRDS